MRAAELVGELPDIEISMKVRFFSLRIISDSSLHPRILSHHWDSRRRELLNQRRDSHNRHHPSEIETRAQQ